MFCRRGRVRRGCGGFSLVELMVVIVIIGLLASIVTVNVRGYLERAKQTAAKQEIANVAKALETFNGAYGRYPTSEEGIEVLTRPGEKMPAKLLTHMPKDPWGRPYQYNCPGTTEPYEVICYGADGREGGEGADADISSERMGE